MYGMKAKIVSSVCTPVDTEGAGVSVGETVEETKSQSEYIWKSAAQNLEVETARYKAQYDKGRKHKDVQIGDWAYVKNQTQSALDPVYHCSYEVVSVIGPDIWVKDPVRGLRVIHLNNYNFQRRSGVVELPYAEVPDGQPNGSVATVIQKNTDAGQTSTGLDMATGLNSESRDLELPIALRKPTRNKAKRFGSEWEI